MNLAEITDQQIAAARRLESGYTNLIGAIGLRDETDVWADIDEAWQAADSFRISQGEINGVFRRESVAYFLGSLPGLTIQVMVDTPGGLQNIDLQISGNQPKFQIQP